MSGAAEAQVRASDPRASVFVSANAGSGKTSTLVKRVARLLLDGARPEAILCVTYTRAGAAEMQRRLFQDLGAWAVMEDAPLRAALADIEEAHRELSKARALFARALETPGGLKIQTIHAFCEKLLRRFPLEAGVSPAFKVLEDAAAAEVSRRARDGVAAAAMDGLSEAVAAAYAHFSVELSWSGFNDMFAAFEARRAEIARWIADCGRRGGIQRETWRLLGFERPEPPARIEAAALKAIRWGQWERAAEALQASTAKTDRELGAAMAAAARGSDYAAAAAVFFTKSGPKARVGTKQVDPAVAAWLADEQTRHVEVRRRLDAARMAEHTCHALALAMAYGAAYEAEKAAAGGLDFADLIERTRALLSDRPDAAWVLYKLDGGLEHILLDEAQDTAPEQWEILRALTAEFFVGEGAHGQTRTLFVVGDEKQSIFSFQGAAPERLGAETQAFATVAGEAQARVLQVPLLESWRSTPQVLDFVDGLIRAPEILAGLRPGTGDNVSAYPIVHRAQRADSGCVDLWPLEEPIPGEEPDVWEPVDAEGGVGADRLLAARIARAVVAMVRRGEAVADRRSRGLRPCVFGDVLILVRRRGALFHEIIRALKREGAPVAGADRLKLSEHGVFHDLLALGRFARFPGDDLTLAALLRSPFCDLDEESLFDLAHGRPGPLWAALTARAPERPAWTSAARLLRWAREGAAAAAPFDFYSRFLGRLDGEGRSMRQRLLTRLGAEGEDALDAFLAQALEAEARGQRDLETFIAAMAANDIEIRRESEEGRGPAGGEVRVMTVHGAKGLEAPVVILPDTSTRVADRSGPLLRTAGGGFLWAPRKAGDSEASDLARQAREQAVEQESARLLYVALTRARDRLIVCGVTSRRFERSWYDFVARAFDALEARTVVLEDGFAIRRYGADPGHAAPEAQPEGERHGLPSWAAGLAPAEPPAVRWASPSSVGDAAGAPATSPLAAVGGLGRYRRGDLIHRLLQLLPDLRPDRWEDAAARLLSREKDLTGDQRAEMTAAALGVLRDARFAEVFGPGSRAEVAIAGAAARLPPGLAVSGRVDRLLVTPERVLVVDYKTNRPAPERLEDADPAYVTQMAVYAAVLAEVFPGRSVEAALLWTDGPRLMPVPAEAIARALAALPAGA